MVIAAIMLDSSIQYSRWLTLSLRLNRVCFTIKRIKAFLFSSCYQVTAKGSPDVALSWIFDLQLGMARLFGQLCSAALDSRKGTYL